MRIAFVTPGFVPVPAVEGGAIEKLMTYLIEQNEEQEYFEIDLYTIDHPKIQTINFKKTHIYRIKPNKIGKLFDRVCNHFFWKYNIEKSYSQFGRQVSRKIQSIKYDYILIENNMYLYKKIYEAVSKKHNETKFIYHLHNDIGKVDKPISLCKFILSTAKNVFTCSKYLQKRLTEIMKTDNVKVLYNVIDFDKLVYSDSAREKIRNDNKVNNNFLYGYIGRISQEKGVLELVRAFKKLYKENEKIKLMIIGDTLFKNTGNKYLNKVKKEISEVSNAIIFTGSIDNNKINEYMSAIDGLVIPTICEEAFGIVAAEGLACERPIIATISGGMVEILNEKTSLLIDKSNIEKELVIGMRKIAMSYDDFIKKSKNGREEIIKNEQFHYENYLDNFYKLIMDYNQ